MKIVVLVIIAYLIGNINPSILIGKAKGIDIKSEGSGNAGTTNTLRVLGKKAAAMTLLIDILKGTVAVLIGNFFGSETIAMYCVAAVFCGHVWPVFFKFKGGKGVATAFGALMGLNPLLGLSCLGIVVIFVLTTMRMSVGSISGAIAFPILTYFIEPDFIWVGSVIAVLILFLHKANIKRLIKGEEPKMNFRK